MDAARQRMVQRLHQQGIRDDKVLRAMNAIPRELFVDGALTNQAYEDTSLPIGLGQTISKPSIVARMVELLMPANGGKLRRILDIGTGCGYQAAILSQLVEEVYSIERLKGLHERARVNLRPLRLKNVHLIYGDGMLGFPSGAPYDAIIVAAGGDHVPAAWLEQLSENGCVIAPISSKAGVQSLIKIVRTSQGWQQYELEAVQFVPLKSGVL
ncbi:MAG: protein-L-isoaspartate(D-aspartate) O-methyltransferase [Saezia sp.]